MPEQQLDIFGGVVLSKQEEKKIENQLMGLVGVFIRPMVAMPPYADMPVPDNLKQAITVERLLLAKDGIEMATELEAMWYISTASFMEPLSTEWTNIYMFLTRKWLLQQGKELPDFLEKEITLEEYTEVPKLKRLREWIYKKSMERIKEKI